MIASVGKTIKGSTIVTFDRKFAVSLKSIKLASHVTHANEIETSPSPLTLHL